MKHHRSHHPFLFFSSAEKKKIVQAIRAAEQHTSGEIRVHLDRGGREDFAARAQTIFEKLGMTRCRERNGVLIFFALAERRFVILGDQGIHAKVPQGFWDEIAAKMQQDFEQDRFADGILGAIQAAGAKLQAYFPALDRNPMVSARSWRLDVSDFADRNPNELPDEISFS